MIPFEFGYFRPDSIQEAMALQGRLASDGQQAIWYAGGTEIISMARLGSIRPRAVMDIKALPECRVMEKDDHRIRFGSCVTLSQVAESGFFPLLGQTVSRIADHTNQCKITLGGNLAGTILYREASLPLWISDAQAELYNPQGIRTVPLASVFDGRLQLAAQEALISLSIPVAASTWPFVHSKLVRADKIDYPLLTLVAAKDDRGWIRLALSGLCDAPFRDAAMESALNAPHQDIHQRIQEALTRIPKPVLEDPLGSAAYRLFRLQLALGDAMEELEET